MNSTFKMLLSFLAVYLLFTWGYRKGIRDKGGFLHLKPKETILSSVGKRQGSTDLREYPRLMSRSNFLINGVPTQIDMYNSNQTPDQETIKYERKWQSKGLKVVRNSFGNMQIVSGLDENFRLFECAIMMQDPGTGKTLVIPASLDLSKPPMQSGYKTLLYPSSQVLFHIESTDMGGYSENIILLNDASVPSIVGFYENKCIQGGWHLTGQETNTFPAPNSRQLLFLKGMDELWVNANRLEDENQTFVYLLYNHK